MTNLIASQIVELPHWRVVFRPNEYEEQRLPSLGACREAIDAAKVRLRGWDYPHVGRRPGYTGHGNNYIDGWSDSPDHLEYWRFLQSAQFLHLFVVREAAASAWAEKLRGHARWHYGGKEAEQAPGFFSLLNVVYTLTEVFEFASRLCQRGTYAGSLSIDVRIRNAQGFGIVPDEMRAWDEHHPLTLPDVGRTWIVDSAQLVANTSAQSLDALMWFFERFGWLDAPREIIARDQDKFLRGLL